MNVISVQWTPNGSPFQRFEIDFTNTTSSTPTDWHIITTCAKPTIDSQSMQPSGGCELILDPASWDKLVGANRGASPVTISVRGTTDGTCASPSTNSVHLSFAYEDLLGTYYYWKSTVSSNGVGGQIWKKVFGDLATNEQNVTSAAIQAATCNGCHSLSRDGSRMVVYSDDDDSDDEYSDVAGSYLDMTTMPNATEFAGGVTGIRMGGQPPGFTTIDPLATFYITSNGFPLANAGTPAVTMSSSAGYPIPVPLHGWSLWNGKNGAFAGAVSVGAAGTRPTMPDWSIDGKTVVYVVPAGEYAWRGDDDHIFGGSLYTMPYLGGGGFGTPTLFLQSMGENNYYPSYSPDVPMSYVIFDRVDDMKAGANCVPGSCLDDSFSNPAARLILIRTAPGSNPVDMEKANGSPISKKVPLSNSYPRWAPFVQTYHGQKLLWFTFSSTRDYGVRIRNHKPNMYQCYPADAAQTPGGIHRHPFDPLCQEPQLWMAPITFTESQGNADPSGVAFWIPYQDPTTHNHTAQWTQEHMKPKKPGCQCSTVYGSCGAANPCGCCPGQNLVCTGNNTCISPPQ
jgi:hypothetical protein